MSLRKLSEVILEPEELGTEIEIGGCVYRLEGVTITFPPNDRSGFEVREFWGEVDHEVPVSE